MSNPLISVVVPTCDGQAFLSEALDSIQAQGHTPLEILVVDDGSTDGTADIVRGAPGTRWVAGAHRGRPAFGRNKGVRLAQGEFVAFLDQDDLWGPVVLQQQLAAFDANPALRVVTGRTQTLVRIHADDDSVLWKGQGSPLPQPFLSASLFRRDVFAQVGLFDESLEFFADDTDWFARARELNVPMQTLDAVTLYWRIHDGNASRALRDHRRGMDQPLLQVVKTALDRRRARGES